MFEYSGYSDIRQLGRNYTLTIDGCTRLYTSVNCYSRRNLKLMSKILSTEISNERSQGSDV